MAITVPTLENRVEEAPFQAPRIRPQGGEEAFGGGQATQQTFNAAAGVASEVEKIAIEQKQKADQLNVLEADKDMSALQTDLLYGKNGAKNRLGKDAFGLPAEIQESFSKGSAEIEKRMTNDAQRLAFKKQQVSRSMELNRTVQAHVAEQIKRFDDQTTESYIANERNAASLAFMDPARIDIGIERQRAAIQQYSDRNGLGPEYVKQKMLDVASKTHLGVIEQMLTNDLDLIGKQYYQTHKEDISADDSLRIQKALEESSLRGESQRNADKIFANNTDRQSALDEARKIQDPKVRDATEERVNHMFSQKLQAQNEAQDKIYLDATNILDNIKGGVRSARDVIPAPMWAKMSLQQRESLERRREDVPNNDKVWLDWLERKPEDIAKMSRATFETKYWSNFDKEHRVRAENEWNKSRSQNEKDPQLSSTLSFKDRFDNSIRNADLVDPTKEKSKFSSKDVKTYAQLEHQAAQAIENFELTQLGGKRKATGEEQQKIIDNLTINKVFVDRPWRPDPQKAVSLLTDDERGHTYVPSNEIPQADRNSIEKLFQSKNSRLTNDKLERVYAAYLEGDRNRIDTILAEK